MKELITRSQADALIWTIGALGVIGGPVAAWIARRRGEDPKKFGVAVGGSLILVAIMWHIYNAVEDKLGLDSVAALAINFGIFVVLGAVIGVAWTMVYGDATKASQSEASSTEAAVE